MEPEGEENRMLKTFLVEDEVVVRETIKRMIPWEQYGFELAGEASDGEMALPLILKSKPDLLITDIKMPFMDGLTLCKLVKKELPGIKIVILSGYDDFNYAKQAISIGVEDYLLKPITKNAFIERLEEIHNRYEHERTQKEYYEKFRLEMQEYERNASRDFFESLVRADSNLEEIYQRADRLNLDIVAEAYNILIFSPDISDSSCNSSEGYSDWEAEVHKKIENYFLSHPVAMLFRHQVFSYAILVKGQKDTIEENTRECVETIQGIMEETGKNADWFVAVGEEADRLSKIKQSYHTAARTYSFRYLYDGHILYYDMLEEGNAGSAEALYTPAAAQVEAIEAAQGDAVKKGQVLFRLRSPELAHELEKLESDRASLRWRAEYMRMNREGAADVPAALRELSALERRIAELKKRTALLEVRSPVDGRVADRMEPLAVGEWLPDGQALAVVAAAAGTDRPALEIVGYVSEQDLNRFAAGASAKFIPEDALQLAIPASVEAVDGTAARHLGAVPELASHFGGAVASLPAPAEVAKSLGVDQGQVFAPKEAIYRVTAAPAGAQQGTAALDLQVRRGTLLIEGERESLAGRFARAAWSVLLRESNF